MFAKPRKDLQSKSAVGGAITVIAGTTTALLFVAQIYLYIIGSARHSLHLSQSQPVPFLPGQPNPFESRKHDAQGKIPLKLHVTFPHLSCDKLELRLDGAAPRVHDFEPGRPARIEKRRPNPIEVNAIYGHDPTKQFSGCTLKARLRIPIVGGQVTISMTQGTWMHATQEIMMLAQKLEGDKNQINEQLGNSYNVSHYIHSIQFGTPFSKAEAMPLEQRAHMIDNPYGGIAVENLQVKLIPTVHETILGTQNTYQLSVVDHTVQPETLVSSGVPVLPGLTMGYDFTPLAVHHVEGRDNFFVFLSSLVSIVGGVFVTVSLFTGCVLHSAVAVAKKKD
eukprot:CAMPEP_0119562520 /NCGR_PEP_ID=MMETSP1352-20130426/20700_1 /TAXON_ID=265584 /ORGANISM="Stauroneis constricta, Strain CCMP1120" /LENGTH=335 /DNA_ID=CAMNT_0007610943 /DNA_START=136 /DNA_END=1143 /DNA_ORIENTATION=+